MLAGGQKGNRGGGRPPTAIRASCREDFDKLRTKLIRIARAKTSKDTDRIRAIEVLAKIGMSGQTINVADLGNALREQSSIIRELLAPDVAEELLQRLKPVFLALRVS